MKRFISIFLVILTILSTCLGVQADETDEQLVSSEVKANMLDYIQDRNSHLLLASENYCYMSFIREFNSNALDLYLIKMTDFLIDTGYQPDLMKYIEVLVNIMAIYELDNASDMAEQCKMDNLKTFKDYAMDIAEMGANAVAVVSGNSSSATALEEGISVAVSGLSCLTENTDNWIEALSNLEVIIQNYSSYDAFLALIEEEAEGDLKRAANILRNSMKKAMLIKLDSYNEVSDTNYENYKEFFFEDVFFTALKQTPEYVDDESFRLFVDAGDSYVNQITTLNAAWDLGKLIGTLVGDVVVGAEDLITRVLEMMAIYDISVILQEKIYDLEVEFLDNYEENVPQSVVDSYILYSQYLIGCQIRGEYCLYSVIANDARLLSWANKESAAKAKETYDNTVNVLLRIQKELECIQEEPLVDISMYFRDIETLIELIDMKHISDSSYESNGFHISWREGNEDFNDMHNDANWDIALYGCRIGDETTVWDHNLKKAGWICLDSYQGNKRYGAIIENYAYDLHLTVNSDNKVTNWMINSFFDIVIPTEMTNLYYETLEEWKKIYLSYVRDEFIEDFPDVKMNFIYVDNDDIPELLLDYSSGMLICGIKDGKIQERIFMESFQYIEKSGLFRVAGGRQHVYYEEIWQLKSGKFERIGSGRYGAYDVVDIDYWDITEENYSYYWNEEKLLKNQYDEKLQSIFDFSKVKDTNFYNTGVTYWEFQRNAGGEENPYPDGL